MSKNIKLFDAHFHIIDHRFPLVGNNQYFPSNYTCNDYISHLRNYELIGGALISGSFQAYDQSYLENALKILGKKYVGVTQVCPTISNEKIKYLSKKGVRGIRFNFKRNSNININELMNLAFRVFDIVKWHVEIYIDSNKLGEIYQRISQLPVVTIDHLGITKDGFETLLKLADKGVRVKASGFGRVEFDVRHALSKLYSVNPDCLMFGTDLPSTRAPRAFDESDIQLILDNFETQAVNKIMYENAMVFYKVS